MIKDITLGQFFPGNSILHKLDPRMKIILVVLYIVALFLARSLLSFVLILTFTFALVPLSGIKSKVIIKGLKPLVFIIVFTAVLNLFGRVGEGDPLLSIGIFRVYTEGIVYSVYMIVRIVCLLCGTSILLTYTTSPIALTDGIEQLLMPLSLLKIPVHEFAMMMTIALRFIPTLIEETDKIMNAQKARGADFSSGGLTKRVKALIPILIPLIVGSFRRADELAVAMECRCYRGGNGRTKMSKLHMGWRDGVMLLVMVLFGVGIVLLNILTRGVGYNI